MPLCSLKCLHFLNSCLQANSVISPRGTLLCPIGVVVMFKKNVKLGVWIIQAEVKAGVVVLDSELFSCRYTQTQDYTLTTPTGSCGSKNKRPNNTHLNLGGTQMSPVVLELHRALLHLPLKLCTLLFCVFILCCSQHRMARLSCNSWSP